MCGIFVRERVTECDRLWDMEWGECTGVSDGRLFSLLVTYEVTSCPRACSDWRVSEADCTVCLLPEVPNPGLGRHCLCDHGPSCQFHAVRSKLCLCSPCRLCNFNMFTCMKHCRINWLFCNSQDFTVENVAVAFNVASIRICNSIPLYHMPLDIIVDLSSYQCCGCGSTCV